MNNRQANNGRRRGRGGQQRQGGSPNQGNGNRIDNRARGNAAQLLEKYKTLARDAQMQGDRVNAEYYLQFADHYFRVLSETRARFEEANPNQPQQRRPSNDIDGDDEDFEYEAGNRTDEPREDFQREDRQDRQPRQDREQPRQDREPREAREPRPPREPREARRDNRDRDDNRNGQTNGNSNGYANGHRAEGEGFAAEAAAPREQDEDRGNRRRPRARRDEFPVQAEASHGIDVAVLPPAFGAEALSEPAGEEAAKKPRRRRVAKGEIPAA